MGMSIACIPIPNTHIPNIVGYNTHTQNTQLFFGYSDDFFLFYQKSILFIYLKNIYSYLNEIITFYTRC